ncbi:major tail protein [Streptococcus caballi]|uniref:major tail protein n=1 Tax=Streptococcus caballi TaxID=439220 RepID=UPI0003743EBB|nr:major tail protein [Streptococcus caballi]
MTKKNNKVEFGLENVHFADLTEADDGSITYGTPERLPGAAKLELEPRGETMSFNADNIEYFGGETNLGYDCTATFAKLTESFLNKILGEVLESDGTVSEVSNAQTSMFALMFQFEGDKSATRHVLYYCKASRPKGGSETKGSNVNQVELSLTAGPRPTDKRVKNRTTKDTPDEVYNNWFKQVHEPAS